LVETVDMRGTPGMIPRPGLFVTHLVFVFGFGHVETTLHHSQYSSCGLSSPMSSYSLFSEVVPNTKQQ